MVKSLSLLVISNVFMTFAWYGHLKSNQNTILWKVILVSWAIAFFEYCFQVPANRIGAQYMNIAQLKVAQEIITMGVFSLFAIFFMKVPLTKNFLYASICLIMAAFFIFRDKV